MTTGWGNEESRRAFDRTMATGYSGRGAIFAVLAGFTVLGVLIQSKVIWIGFGVAALLAGVSVFRAWLNGRAVRRIELRYRDAAAGEDSAK